MISNKKLATSAEQAVNDVLTDLHIKYKGKSDYIKWTLEFTAHRVLARLLTDEQRKSLNVLIHVRKHSVHTGKVMAKNGLRGSVKQIDQNSYYIQISRDQFFRKILETLIHELCHVAQYVTGILVTTELNCDETTIWMGTTYQSDMKYSERPWEIDAFALEKKLWYLTGDVLGFGGRELFHATRGIQPKSVEACIVDLRCYDMD